MNYRFFSFLLIISLVIFSSSCVSKNKVIEKKQAEAFRNLGEAYMKQGLYSAALKELLNSEELESDDPFLQNDLGRTYLALDKLDLAILHFKKAVKIKPDYAPAINNLGAAYLAQKNWDAAIETFNELSKNLLYGTPHYPLSNLGFAYYNKGMYEKAELNYKAALDIEPQFMLALRGLGKTYLKMGKTDKSIKFLDKAVSVAPKVGELRADLAKAYISNRKFKNAVFHLKKVIELEEPGSDVRIEAEGILDKLERKK